MSKRSDRRDQASQRYAAEMTARRIMDDAWKARRRGDDIQAGDLRRQASRLRRRNGLPS